MAENTISEIMGVTMDKVKSMANTSTIIGDPIIFGDISVIPVSKISYGFASGGSDFGGKQAPKMFGGGGGAGMTITPIAFLAIQNGNVKILHIDSNPNSTDKIVNAVPEVIERIVALFKRDKKDKTEEEKTEEEKTEE